MSNGGIKPTWVETGQADGLLSGLHSNDKLFYASGSVSGSFHAFAYSNKSSLPHYPGNYVFKLYGANGNSPKSTSKFDASEVYSPGGPHTSTRKGTLSFQPSGPYFMIEAGSESSCVEPKIKENNWWDACTGSSHDCLSGGEGPNIMSLDQKVYDKATSKWVWDSHWAASSSSAIATECSGLGTLLDSNSFCGVHNVDMLFSWSTSGSNLNSAWSGEYTG